MKHITNLHDVQYYVSELVRNIERRGNEYFVVEDGEDVQVLGARTLTETRWDFIFDDALRTYGLLRSVARVVAIRNVCFDYRLHPDAYPETTELRLSEDQHGQTWFLHWYWDVPWPYQRKYLPWLPECPQCNPDWLLHDLIAWFADKEHVPGRDTAATQLTDDVAVFRERTRDYPWQREVAVDTDLRFGDGAETWFTFRGQPIRWVNRTAHVLTTLVIPSRTLGSADPTNKLVLEFISAMVFHYGRPIRIVASGGGGRRLLPLLRQPHQFGGIGVGSPAALKDDYASGSGRALAVSLFAEAVNSGSTYYAFLSFYKVIELAHRGVKHNVLKWINDNLASLRVNQQPERVERLRNQEPNVAQYLYVQNRCAIAHAATKPIADPDDPTDRQRLASDLPVVEALARKAIEGGLFDEPASPAPSSNETT